MSRVQGRAAGTGAVGLRLEIANTLNGSLERAQRGGAEVTEYQCWSLAIQLANLLALAVLVAVTVGYARSTKRIAKGAADQTEATRMQAFEQSRQLAAQTLFAELQAINSRALMVGESPQSIKEDQGRVLDQLAKFARGGWPRRPNGPE